MKRVPHLSRALFLLFIASLFVSLARPIAARPHEAVTGCFYFYDYKLDAGVEQEDNEYGVGQAKITEGQEHATLLQWNNGAGNCLRFSPEKVGESVSFRIHIAQVGMDRPYKVRTNAAVFHNEGIYQLLVNDQPIGPEHDCFAEQTWEHGEFSVTPGDYKITYRYVGKNPKSPGSVLDICWIGFD